ncbi:MAG: FlgD immunoglobulin-like domain containing protein, partial [Beijerinckiaceae bacterium]
TNEVTQQLVQFASVEQQLKTNDTLSALLSSAQASNLSNAVGFVGKTIVADGSSTMLSNGSAKWQVKLPRDARMATFTVTDAAGNVVWTEQKPMAAGANTYSWSGRTSAGALAPNGSYKLTVAAVDASGSQVTPSIEFSGVVEGVKIANGVTVLQIGEFNVPLDKVTSITR